MEDNIQSYFKKKIMMMGIIRYIKLYRKISQKEPCLEKFVDYISDTDIFSFTLIEPIINTSIKLKVLPGICRITGDPEIHYKILSDIFYIVREDCWYDTNNNILSYKQMLDQLVEYLSKDYYIVKSNLDKSIGDKLLRHSLAQIIPY